VSNYIGCCQAFCFGVTITATATLLQAVEVHLAAGQAYLETLGRPLPLLFTQDTFGCSGNAKTWLLLAKRGQLALEICDRGQVHDLALRNVRIETGKPNSRISLCLRAILQEGSTSHFRKIILLRECSIRLANASKHRGQ
jgi:hypothetical protein